MTESRYTDDGRKIIIDRRQTGLGWELVDTSPTWARKACERDIRLDDEVCLELVSIRYVDIYEYSASLGRQSARKIDEKVERTDKRSVVCIPAGSQLEYARKSEVTLLHVKDVSVDGKQGFQLSFERCKDGKIRPKLQPYSAGTMRMREEHRARY